MGKMIFFLNFLFLFSCSSKPDPVLVKAENLMDSMPAQALQMLRQIKETQKLDRANQAYYALLSVKATDKNALPIESDSLIRIALSYYKSEGDAFRLAESYYYLGCYFVGMGMTDEAVRTFLQAEEIAEPVQAWNLLGLIYGRLGNEYQKQQDWHNAIKMERYAITCFKEAYDVSNECLGYLALAQLLFCNSVSEDSCIFYMEKARKGFLSIHDTLNYANTLMYEAKLHLSHSEFDQVYNLLQQVKKLYKDSLDTDFLLTSALFYEYQENFDSARILMKKIQNVATNFDKAGTLYLLSKVDERSGYYESAFKQLEKGFLLQDSVYDNHIKNSVYRYTKLYDRLKAERQNQELNIRLKMSIAIIIVLMMILFLIYFIYQNRLNCRNKEIAEFQLRKSELINQISILQKKVQTTVDKKNIEAFFVRQQQMLKEIMQANSRNIHNEKKRTEEIAIIREKYFSVEKWEDIKTGINILHSGCVDYLEKRYKDCLSDKEMKICILTWAGFSIREVALYLKLTEKTVYNLRSHICKMLSEKSYLSLEQLLKEIRAELEASH